MKGTVSIRIQSMSPEETPSIPYTAAAPRSLQVPSKFSPGQEVASQLWPAASNCQMVAEFSAARGTLKFLFDPCSTNYAIIIYNHGRPLPLTICSMFWPACNTLHKLIKIFSRASFTARGGPATRVPRPRSSRATACVFRQKYFKGAKIFRIKQLYLQANPIVVLNALGYIGFKVVSTCGDTEVRK